MIVNIPTTTDKIFKQYLTFVNGLLSKDKRLTDLEIEVLDKLLYIDYTYRNLSKDKRDIILFHKQTKDKIREAVYNISEQSFNNLYSKLRRKGYIDFNSLKTRIPIKDGKIEIQFKLEIHAETDRADAQGISSEV